MITYSHKIVFTFVILALMYAVFGSEKIKREYADFFPLTDVSKEIADQDLESGLESLSSAELKTLSEFIDEESKSPESMDFQKAVENYWEGASSSKSAKKKRTIDDLYEELAHENAEIKIRSDSHNKPSKVLSTDGKCHCEKPDGKDDAIRTKRHSLRVNAEKDPNIEEYVRELEDSFPRDQQDNINDANSNVGKNEHIRIKRL